MNNQNMQNASANIISCIALIGLSIIAVVFSIKLHEARQECAYIEAKFAYDIAALGKDNRILREANKRMKTEYDKDMTRLLNLLSEARVEAYKNGLKAEDR